MTRPQKRLLSVSWAETFQSLPALKSHSDLAVMGTITSVLGHLTDNSTGMQYTDFGLVVKRVLNDPNHLTPLGATLSVHQTGGVDGHITQEVADDPLFAVGASTVVFLVQYDPGHFKVAGGPTGRFIVANGSVHPVNSEGVPFSGSVDALAHAVAAS